jgi:hypothetical protein
MSARPSDQLVPAAERRTLTVTGSGDILIHPTLAGQAESNSIGNGPEFGRLLAGVRKRISAADYSICHNETPYSAPGDHQPFPHYYVHPNLANGIAATGWDECSLASNWTFDKGLSGIRRTIGSLNDAKVREAGAAGDSNANRVVVRAVGGIKFVHLSYTDPADSPALAGKPWAINRQTPTQIAADARQARMLGAEIVVVSLAMGSMGSTPTSKAQRRAVTTITAGGDVDFIIGHGAHNIQPPQRSHGVWAIWHGNVLASFFEDQAQMHEGLISWVTFTETTKGRFDASVKLYPVLMQQGERRVIDLAAERCSDWPTRWADAYSATRNTLRDGLDDGLKLAKPCSDGGQ